MVPAEWRKCRIAVKAYPIVTVSDGVLLDDRLKLESVRVFYHWFNACMMHQKEQITTTKLNAKLLPLFKMMFQGFNTVMFMMRSQDYFLAAKSISLLKDVMS